MSRNLGRTNCRRCEGAVTLTGPAHPITLGECGEYLLAEYAGMTVADATCSVCGALYVAWVNGRPDWMIGHLAPRNRPSDAPFVDLSYRSTFNDEPGEGDLPPWSPPPGPTDFVPANVGRDFWRRGVEWTDDARVAVFVGAVNDRVGLHWRFNGQLIDTARADADRDFWLLPREWRLVNGRLMRPVTAEELPA